MKAEQYAELVVQAVDESRDGYPQMLVSIGRALAEADEAKQILRARGYGWLGLGIAETAREV